MYKINTHDINGVRRSLQHFSSDYVLASHITDVACVNFIVKWRQLQLKADSEWIIILRKILILSLYTLQCFYRKYAGRKLSIEISFHIPSYSKWLTWDLNHGLTSNKPTYYLLDLLVPLIITHFKWHALPCHIFFRIFLCPLFYVGLKGR